jgi:hypothetical protein
VWFLLAGTSGALGAPSHLAAGVAGVAGMATAASITNTATNSSPLAHASGSSPLPDEPALEPDDGSYKGICPGLISWADAKAKELPRRKPGNAKGWEVVLNNGDKVWDWGTHNDGKNVVLDAFPVQAPHNWNTIMQSPPDPRLINIKAFKDAPNSAPPAIPTFEDFCISKCQVYFWKPDAYFLAQGVEVKCPRCKSVDPSGAARQVAHKGWRPLRRVCDNNNTSFLMSFEYTCKHCSECTLMCGACSA